MLPYRRRDGRLEVLIAHMGGPMWARRDEAAWTIVKGEHDESEEALAAARREFEEETGAAAARRAGCSSSARCASPAASG